MRYPDGALIGDANDNFRATSSVSLSPLVTSSFNENLTSYDLLPVIINKTPTVVSTVVGGSTPTIRSINLVDGSGQNLYINTSGVIRVCIGTSLTLRFAAQQPDKLNVENGLLVMIPDQTDLVYTWRVNDTPLADFELGRLRSTLKVDRGECAITNIQIAHSGTYQCEVSNDIGSVLSESIVIEVYNPDADPKLYSNLIINPYGQEGVDGWNASTSEFVTKEMSTTSADQFKIVNNVNVFGYTADMMHPRPYQLDSGVLRGVDLAGSLTRRGTYFSRAPYKFLSRGGSTYVKAYQDVDLSDLTDLIAGGVYGISGLRGIFGCYIGTGISNYVPTEELTPINNRKNRREHFFGAPRLSVENWLAAGKPELIDRAYVTIEEFQDQTRLASRLLDQSGQSTLEARVITLHDPYTKAISQTPSTPYYPGSAKFPSDQYQLGFSSPNQREDRILHAADSLMPNYEDRFTFGQYVEFNRVVLDKLNPRTNKIRIALNFFCEDYRLTEPGTLSELGSDEVWDFHGWSRPSGKNTFGDASSTDSIYDRLNVSDQVPATEKFLTQPDPRPIITGLVLGLVPILNERSELTTFYTNRALATNTVQQSEVPSQLLEVPFDPFERQLKRLHTTFLHQSSFSSSSVDITAISFQVEPNQGEGYQLPITEQRLFPFVTNLPVDFHIGDSVEDSPDLMQWRVVSSRRGDLVSVGDWGSLLVRTGSLLGGTPWSNYAEIGANTRNLAAQGLSSNVFAKATDGPSGALLFDDNGSQSIPNEWNGKVRYILHYVVRQRGVDNAESNLILTANTAVNPNQTYIDEIISSNERLPYNSYLLEIQHPTGDRNTRPIVTLSRTTEMVGSGSLDPVEVEHGISSQGDFYFKLPSQILYNGIDQGGLGLGFSGQFVTQASILSRSGSLPIQHLFGSASLWWNTGELYGDTIRRQVIQSIFVGPEDGLVVTTDGVDAYVEEVPAREQYRNVSKEIFYQGLVDQAIGTLDSTSRDNLIIELSSRYERLYGTTGNAVKVRNIWPFNTRKLDFSDLQAFSYVGPDTILDASFKSNVWYDNKEAAYYPSSSAGLSGSVVLVPTASADIDNTALVFAQSLLDSNTRRVQAYRNSDKAVSLYAVQAVGYGAVSGSVFGGTPMLGYDSDGSYYQVDIKAIQDNIIHEGTSPINLEV